MIFINITYIIKPQGNKEDGNGNDYYGVDAVMMMMMMMMMTDMIFVISFTPAIFLTPRTLPEENA